VEEGELVSTGEILVDNHKAKNLYYYRVVYKSKGHGKVEMVNASPLLKHQVLIEFPGCISISKLHVACSGRAKVEVFAEKERMSLPTLPERSLYTTFLDHSGQEMWGWRTNDDENIYISFQNRESISFDVYVSAVVTHIDPLVEVEGG
jgi:hypothetical protein